MSAPATQAAPAAPEPIAIPAFSLVLLVGASGAGKTTFARANFSGGEVVSSDECRRQVADDADDLAATGPAFELLRKVIELRLRGRRLTVVDATNLRPEDRTALRAMALEHHALPVAIVLNPGEAACRARVAARGGPGARAMEAQRVVERQHAVLRGALPAIVREKFKQVHVLGIDDMDRPVVRTRLWTDREDESGPFDFVGDVHGCHEELLALLAKLGWEVFPEGTRPRAAHPEGRKAVFVGDLVDRGPDVGGVLRLVMDMVEDGTALCVAGNHEAKVERWLRGTKVKMTHGLDRTVEAIEAGGRDFRIRVGRFIGRLVSHYMLDGGRICVAHAGITEALQGRASGAVREFCLFGPTTGEIDAEGLPTRTEWVPDYRGAAKVVFGHTPVVRSEWVNGTICLDTGCVFGGSLTALRYPEMEVVSVPAARVYHEAFRPFKDTGQHAIDRDLDIADVMGKRIVETRLMGKLVLREAEVESAIEDLSRHSVDPRWLVYLPPTMAPCATASEPGYLEHPREAFAQYRRDGVAHVIAEEKHMGSRATLALCRDPGVAEARFGVADGSLGEAWTRTGRPFFDDRARRNAVLRTAVAACESGGLFEALGSDWVVIDAEVMPWSEKALGLVRGQYAPLASAARAGLGLAGDAMRAAIARGLDLSEPLAAIGTRLSSVEAFADEVRRYAPAMEPGGLRIAPFHVLASEGFVHHGRDHRWHLAMASRLADADPLFARTRSVEVDLGDPASEEAATRAWVEATESGSEGFVIKPVDFVVPARRGIVQPAAKCRGRAYLRIVYGPGYDEPASLARLRQRSLATKRSLALREFALGIEGLERFVRREPLRRVHECAMGVLALESGEVDARL